MAYRDKYLTDDERFARLEDAVAKNTTRRIYDTIKYGIQVFLSLAGVALILFGSSFVVDSCASYSERMAALPPEPPVSGQVEYARNECVHACEAAGMSIQRAILQRSVSRTSSVSDRAVACSCVSPTGTRVLWNDHSVKTETTNQTTTN